MPDTTPTLYILCGLPGAGKTTLATAITKARDIAYVSLDHIKADEGFFVSDADVPEAEWPGIHDVVHASLLMPLRLGRSVIYDASNLRREQRDELRALSASRKFASRVVYVAVPEATARERAPDAIGAALSGFEEPSKDEDVIVYAPTQDIAKWVKANF
jgi:predicted kinase